MLPARGASETCSSATSPCRWRADYAFIHRIRPVDAPGGSNTPALALTALAGSEDRRRALAARFQIHLAKPADVDHLTGAARDLAMAGRPGPLVQRPRDSREH
jgi:CheY-like chemotaxis protein